jgi:hypothetical protein
MKSAKPHRLIIPGTYESRPRENGGEQEEGWKKYETKYDNG